MRTIIIFDINQKPQLAIDDVAYLVDKSNVDLLRQYVDKYYQDTVPSGSSWSEWFDSRIGNYIECNINNEFILYFKDNSLGWDNGDDAVAYDDGYDIYYIQRPKQLMKVE